MSSGSSTLLTGSAILLGICLGSVSAAETGWVFGAVVGAFGILISSIWMKFFQSNER